MNKIRLNNVSIAIIFCFCIIVLITSSKCFNKQNEDSYVPGNGFVPDEVTAIKIAETIWLPIYGKEIYKHKPFKAVLIDGKQWLVFGYKNPFSKGGVPYARIQKSDCKIIQVIHTK